MELLAPAGDLEKLKFAFLYGADAVYIGGENFSLRANAKNFSLQDIEKGVTFAHQLHKKVYVTVNIIFHNEDFEGLVDYLKKLSELQVDAVIVSDVAVIDVIVREHIPLNIHLSTQASVLNPMAAKFYKKMGVTRLVLAREASKEDILAIKKETGLELEVFVHGAMCTSFSGRCILSNVCTNRDANRGGCAQVCRWVFETDEEPFSMTSKDLNMIPFIKEMMEIGVDSFKVEGRMRGIYYIATVIHTYRRLIDKIKDHTLSEKEAKYDLDILNRVANRESMPQFYGGIPKEEGQYYLGREEVSNQDFLGMVLEYDETRKVARIEQRNFFKVGDQVEFFGPQLEPFSYEIHTIKSETGLVDVANHPGEILELPVEIHLHQFDMMRIKIFDKKDYL